MAKKRKKCILPYAGYSVAPEVCGEYGSKVFGFDRTDSRREQKLLGKCISMSLVGRLNPAQKASRLDSADCVQQYIQAQ